MYEQMWKSWLVETECEERYKELGQLYFHWKLGQSVSCSPQNHQLKAFNHGKQQMLGRQLKSYDNLEIQLSLFNKQEQVIFLLSHLTLAINLSSLAFHIKLSHKKSHKHYSLSPLYSSPHTYNLPSSPTIPLNQLVPHLQVMDTLQSFSYLTSAIFESLMTFSLKLLSFLISFSSGFLLTYLLAPSQVSHLSPGYVPSTLLINTLIYRTTFMSGVSIPPCLWGQFPHPHILL